MKQKPFILAVILFLLLSAACTVIDEPAATNNISQSESQPLAQEDVSAYEELTLRLIAPMFMYSENGETGEVALLVGEAPDAFTMPLDESAVIVGSVTYNTNSYQVVVDTALEPAEFFDYMASNIEASGWREPNMPSGYMDGGGGFVGGSMPSNGMYCLDGDESVMMMVSADKPDRNAPTDVRFNVNHDEMYSPCAEDFDMMGGGPPDVYMLMPTMRTPSGARQTGGGGGGGERHHASTTATLATTLSISELLTHYNGELEAAAWEKASEDAGETIATSSWTFTDEEGDLYHGTFIAISNAQLPEQRTVYFELTKAP